MTTLITVSYFGAGSWRIHREIGDVMALVCTPDSTKAMLDDIMRLARYHPDHVVHFDESAQAALKYMAQEV